MGEDPIVQKNYPCNYLTGSRKAMEDSASLDIIMGLHENNVGIQYLVWDDDSTMRDHLIHIC